MRRLAALILFALFGALIYMRDGCAQMRSKDTPAQWEIDAGGKMAFSVASVKPNKASAVRGDFPLDEGDAYKSDRGVFKATNSLSTYIAFAYKLTPFQQQNLDSQLRKQGAKERFEVEARGPADATKDQVRLMMQSLLADQFKFAAHRETKQGSGFALRMVKSGEFGPGLRPYPADPPCSTTITSLIPNLQLVDPKIPRDPSSLDELQPLCDSLAGRLEFNGFFTFSIWTERNVSMQRIADDLAFIDSADLNRPVWDETGLKGNYDFVLKFNTKWRPSPGEGPPPVSADVFLQALREDLGLRVVSQNGPVEVLVVDHIEKLSTH